MAKYRITTFRGCSYKGSYESALQEAKDMIMDIIVDGHPIKRWWSVISYESDGEHVATVHCPSIGKWCIINVLKN